MKRRNRFFFVWLAIGLVLLTLSTFQTVMAGEQPPDTGLIPDQTSTGDPPLIPHKIDEVEDGEECLGCHKDGDDGAPKIPEWHDTITHCRQCHIPYVENSDVFKPQY